MFQTMTPLAEDSILGLMVKFKADPSKHKVDLGVGVFRDAQGATPVLKSVRQSESQVLSLQDSKSYVGPGGRLEFNDLATELVLGADHPALAQHRVRTLQTPGGCGALRLGAELLHMAAPSNCVHVSDPTWGNHVPLLSGSGLELKRYPYYDSQLAGVDFHRMSATLRCIATGDAVLLHGCCHNPAGADLSQGEWHAVADILRERGALPFIDLAYQGFGTGLDEDAYGARLVARQLPEALIAVSFSKNFGLYRERVGALICVGETPASADAMLSRLLQIARSMYSMPPDHGAAIVAHILSDRSRREIWSAEVAHMRERIQQMRKLLTDALRARTHSSRFDFIAAQHGMFSLLGATPSQVAALRERHHVYMTADSRMNIAGITPHNAHYLADAIVDTLVSPAANN